MYELLPPAPATAIMIAIASIQHAAKMQQRFQDSTADGQRLIRYVEAVDRRASWVDVAGLHVFFYARSGGQHSAQQPVYCADDRSPVNLGGNLPCAHKIAYLAAGKDDAVAGGPQPVS